MFAGKHRRWIRSLPKQARIRLTEFALSLRTAGTTLATILATTIHPSQRLQRDGKVPKLLARGSREARRSATNERGRALLALTAS